MFILTFNNYPELPKNKSKFYWNVFDTLATKHDSFTKKGGYQHERKTKLDHEQFEKILKWLSYVALFQGKYSFDAQYFTKNLNDIKTKLNLPVNTQDLIQDLTLAIAIVILDGIEYKFPHKSLQEYFCAALIAEQEPNIKEKIYSTKLQQQIIRSAGGNDNFWSLCLELDRIYFTKYFLIKQLEKIETDLSQMEPFELVWHFYNISAFSQSFLISEGRVKGFNGYGWGPDFTVQLISFAVTPIGLLLQIPSMYIDVNNSPKLFSLIRKYDRNPEPTDPNKFYSSITFKEIPAHLVKEALEEVRHIQRFYSLKDMIRQKILQLYNDIAVEEQNKESLLDLL